MLNLHDKTRFVTYIFFPSNVNYIFSSTVCQLPPIQPKFLSALVVLVTLHILCYINKSYHEAVCLKGKSASQPVTVTVVDIAGGKEAEGVWEYGVEQNIWT